MARNLSLLPLSFWNLLESRGTQSGPTSTSNMGVTDDRMSGFFFWRGGRNNSKPHSSFPSSSSFMHVNKTQRRIPVQPLHSTHHKWTDHDKKGNQEKNQSVRAVAYPSRDASMVFSRPYVCPLTRQNRETCLMEHASIMCITKVLGLEVFYILHTSNGPFEHQDLTKLPQELLFCPKSPHGQESRFLRVEK